MSRQTYLLGLALALVTGALLLTEALLWRPGATRANVLLVRRGMSHDEVVAVLGPPVHDHMRRLRIALTAPTWEHSETCLQVDDWEGPDGAVTVAFSPAGKVVGSHFSERQPTSPSPIARLLAWLRR